jgi:osmotically-inducible protein OsmY
MSRSPLLFVTLCLSLILAGCSGRSIGNKIDDQFVGPDVERAIENAHKELASPTSHIVVSSYNGVVLLAGQTPRNELKETAERAARSVQGVRNVHNELTIAAPSSGFARSNDAILTTRIKTQMFADSSVPGSRIKVITENGIVYLLGLVTRAEANSATGLIQSVSGVQRIVRLFEYTD